MPTRTKELSIRALKMKELEGWHLGRTSTMRHRGDMKTILPLQPLATSTQVDVPTVDVLIGWTPTALPVYLGYIRLIDLSLYSLSPYKMDVNTDCTNQASPDSMWSKLPWITRLKSTTLTHGDHSELLKYPDSRNRRWIFTPLLSTIITMRKLVFATADGSKMDA